MATPTDPTVTPPDPVPPEPPTGSGDRLAFQVWVIMFLLVICVALLKFILGY